MIFHLLILRMFRISGFKNIIGSRAFYRTATPRPLEFLPSQLLVIKPSDFNAVHTNYGWFIIPKHYYAYRWTIHSINKAIENVYPDILTNLRPHELLQEVVDEWGRTVDITNKPMMSKITRADVKKQKDEALYRNQLKEESQSTNSPTNKQSATPKKRAKLGTITFIHAWNYYFSITHPKYSHLDKKESRREIANEWNALTTDDKEEYREAYAKLLSEGKDIHRGKIVTREEKLRRQPTKKKTANV